MKFIVEPSNNGIWVAIKPELEKEGLVERLLSSDILISDLDDTDAPSPAKAIARNGLTTLTYLKDPKYWLWVLATGYTLAKNGKSAESEAWLRFVQRFLRNPKELEKLRRIYTSQFAASTFYPGVLDFYRLMPEEMIKIYVTRDILEVADAYKQAAGFNEAMSEQFDKKSSIREIVNKYPERRRFVLKVDSPEEESTLEFLVQSKRLGKIDEVTSIWVTDSPHKLNPKFDANIPRNYNGLVQLIKEAYLPIIQNAY